jgi:hypothetical protein
MEIREELEEICMQNLWIIIIGLVCQACYKLKHHVIKSFFIHLDFLDF